MALYNFELGANAILSYQTSYPIIYQTYVILNLQLVGDNSKILHLAFSLLILKEDDPDI